VFRAADGEANDRARAIEIRRRWMTLMGLSAEEIAEHCQPGMNLVLEDELNQLAAMTRICGADR
jgi:hypothetical protein